jgi:hypothetical protein
VPDKNPQRAGTCAGLRGGGFQQAFQIVEGTTNLAEKLLLVAVTIGVREGQEEVYYRAISMIVRGTLCP